ncbi:MAG: NIPSNAP family protein [Acidobacteriota bacterium]|nr:NIPSNAP family protein [Acidobacteriota bacterium]
MERRQFLTASMAAAALGVAGKASAQESAKSAREYYRIEKYTLQNGQQTKLTETYLNDALIPALARRGMGPVGAFALSIGPETPTYYVLIPGPDPAAMAKLELDLSADDDFVKSAKPFWAAPAAAPAFLRVEISLLAAFEGWPKLTPPPSSATKARRIFQLRTYEGPSFQAHVDKVKMFHSGEFEIFAKAGFHMVFFGDTLVGSRMPNLTYMLSFEDSTELDARWKLFSNDPTWKKLSADPRFAYEPIVSNITNLVLNPLASSQI